MPYINIDGEKIYYAGNNNEEGLPIVFCHGSGGGHHHWVFQLQGLKDDNFNPIAVDLPGHGKSAGSASNEIAVYRDWLSLFTRKLELKPFVIAGNSMGGAIALDYALHYPGEICGLILIGSGCKLRVLPELLGTLSEGNVPNTLVDYLYSTKTEQDIVEKGREEVEATDPSVYYADLSACDMFNVTEELHRIEKPVLMICGSDDRLTPVKYSRYLEENLPDGKVIEIGEAGHMVMLEKPEEVNRAIAAFAGELIDRS